MPQNIESYRNDRKIIKSQYEKILDLIINQYQITRYLSEKMGDNSNDKEVQELKLKTNMSCNELLETITWTISKQQPISQDLRFLVALISSIRDFRRLSDYSFNISRHLIKFGFRQENLLFIETLCDQIIKIICDMRSVNIDSKNYSNEIMLVVKDINHFRKYYNENIISNLQVAIKDFMESDGGARTLSATFNFKGLERAADHVSNIIENMLYVETDTFFDPRITNINKNFKDI